MNTIAVRNLLISLYKIVEASEKGYAVVTSNVKNRALKVLFQSYSQQRLQFKDEIFEEISRLGGDEKSPADNILGMMHRGRIDIFATLTIGDENVERVLLKEVWLGERVALKSYEKTLKEELPPATRSLIESQLQTVRKNVEQIRLLRGQDGKRLVLRLYDSRQDAEQALQSLKQAGVSEKNIKIQDFDPPALEPYKGRGTTLIETVLSGGVGGAVWGVVAGILGAISVMQIAARTQDALSPNMVMIVALGLTAAGIFIGSMVGLFISWGVASQDSYVSETVKKGEVLMETLIDESLASRAWRIMNQVAVAARARHAGESAA
ncbi:MAG TPA: PA2169 family four-helix-bundle protein [Anaerolineales bacterium]|nr:PA2169 family four-helix-bundle protein [Anaerolineales bacterium]